MLKPGVYSFPLLISFVDRSATIGVELTRDFGESLTGVRQSCPRLGETNAPDLSRTIALAGCEALGGDWGGDADEDFLVRLGEDGGGVTRFTTVFL